MQLDSRKIKTALDICQGLRDVYFTNFHKDKPYVCVNDLLEIVRTTYNKNVILSFLEEDHHRHSMVSFVHVYEDGSYEICLLDGLTNCWQRFALCKELFHVILDEENHRNPNIAMHLSDFRQSVRDYNVDGSEASCNEILTEFAAMQFLFPYSRRLGVVTVAKTRISNGENRKDVYRDIAIEYRLPRLMIEEYLSDDMIEFFDSISWIDRSDKRR